MGNTVRRSQCSCLLLGVRRESISSEMAGRTPPQSFKIAIPRSNYFPSALDLHAFRLTVYSGGTLGPPDALLAVYAPELASGCGLKAVLASLASCSGLAGLLIRIPASWIAALASSTSDGLNNIVPSVSPICAGVKPAAN